MAPPFEGQGQIRKQSRGWGADRTTLNAEISLPELPTNHDPVCLGLAPGPSLEAGRVKCRRVRTCKTRGCPFRAC